MWCTSGTSGACAGAPVVVRSAGGPDQGVLPARAAVHPRVPAHPRHEPQP